MVGSVLAFFSLVLMSEAALLDIYIIGGQNAVCPAHYTKVRTTGSLDGDLNQDVKGQYIYLCVRYGVASESEEPIEELVVLGLYSSAADCGDWTLAPHDANSNGDLNQNSGGPWIYLCYKRGTRQPVEDIYLSESRECELPYAPITSFGAHGGDLNDGVGGKYIYVCEKLGCVATKVVGEWKAMYTVAAPTTETWKHGTSKKFSTSKTEDWSKSVSAKVSAGFKLFGFGQSIEISGQLAKSTSRSYESEWSVNDEVQFSVSWGQSAVGKFSWQFQFSPYDSCGNTEHSLTKEKAATEGRWRPPCCLPGYSTDAPLYSKCWSAEVMIPDGDSFGCTVATTRELSEHFRGLNQSVPDLSVPSNVDVASMTPLHLV